MEEPELVLDGDLRLPALDGVHRARGEKEKVPEGGGGAHPRLDRRRSATRWTTAACWRRCRRSRPGEEVEEEEDPGVVVPACVLAPAPRVVDDELRYMLLLRLPHGEDVLLRLVWWRCSR